MFVVMFLAWFCLCVGIVVFVLPRWFCGVNDVRRVVAFVMDVSSRYLPLVISCGRGRRPIMDVRIYIALIVVKEFSRSSLRYAEDNYSLLLFGERIDHGGIHYWEKRLRRLGKLEKILEDVGRVLDDRLGYRFSVLDWTELTTWSMDSVRVTLTVRMSYGTVYPVRAYVSTPSTDYG